MDAGLERVVAAETVLSDVDGEAGRLVIRGYPIEALAGHVGYEEVIHLLWDGFFSDLPARRDLRAALGAARVETFALLAEFRAAGLTDVHLEPIDLTFTLGASPDDAMGYLVESGPGRLLLETIPDGTARQAALADVRDTLADHTDDGTVQLGGAIWLISAARPPANEATDS